MTPDQLNALTEFAERYAQAVTAARQAELDFPMDLYVSMPDGPGFMISVGEFGPTIYHSP